MGRLAVVSIALAFVLAGCTHQPRNDAEGIPFNCASALQFNEQRLISNYAARYSVLNSVTQSNYSQMKSELEGIIPDLFQGSFQQFQERRNEFRSLFTEDQITLISSDLYQRALAPGAMDGFNRCVAHLSNSPIIAWVSSTGDREEEVYVTVRRQLGGTSTMTYTISSAYQPVEPPRPFVGAGEQTLRFRVPRNRAFRMAINASMADGGSWSPPPIELPAYVEMRQETDNRTFSGIGHCGAGCQGSTTGCQDRRPAIINSSDGFTLRADTWRITRQETLSGPGLVQHPQWSWVSRPQAAPITMTGTPSQCEGMSGDTQSNVSYTIVVDAVRRRMVVVP